jgi:ferrous iron transport protein A
MFGSVIARLQGRTPLDADLADRAAGLRMALPESRAQAEATALGGDARDMVPLTRLPRDATGIVAGVRVAPPGVVAESDPALERMALRLIEIGFVQGERLRVVAFGQPGDDPIGVRIGGRGGSSVFALRRQEAGCVWVWPDR